MIDIKQAVILAGGMGTRLKPLTDTLPKPMVPIHGRPFLAYLLERLRENGISEVVLLLGYLSHKVMEHFGDGSGSGIRIRYSVGDVAFETGTRIRHAEPLLQDHFLLLYCDNYWPLVLKNLLAFHNRHNGLATATVYSNTDGFTKNNVRVDDKGLVLTYDKTRKAADLNGVEIGFFILGRETLRFLPRQGNVSFETTVLARLVEEHRLFAYITHHRYYSIGSLERIPLTERFLGPKKVIFLDRDGVINKRPPKAEYIKSWSDFEFLPGARAALKELTQQGYEIYVITNQAGIARGIMTEADLQEIHGHLVETLSTHGARIHGFYHCPHGWDEGCSCRKPRPGLFYQAARDHHVDLTKALFIGDDERDGQAGEAAGVRTLLVTPEQNLLEIVRSLGEPH